jgi:hypothetical protein
MGSSLEAFCRYFKNRPLDENMTIKKVVRLRGKHLRVYVHVRYFLVSEQHLYARLVLHLTRLGMMYFSLPLRGYSIKMIGTFEFSADDIYNAPTIINSDECTQPGGHLACATEILPEITIGGGHH